MFWKRKPVTHAIALWILVGLAAAGLVALLAYLSLLTGLRKGVVEARPAKTSAIQEQPPTLFGRITAVEGGVIRIDSKQPFGQVLFDADTDITSVGGSAASAEDLRVGAVVTATGKDLGDGRMAAAAIVILQAP